MTKHTPGPWFREKVAQGFPDWKILANGHIGIEPVKVVVAVVEPWDYSWCRGIDYAPTP